MDRVVGSKTSFSSGQQDIINWLFMLDAIEDKDFVVINVDEIFSTMDKKYSKAFSTVFINELIKKGKYAIIISHNHEFNKEMSYNPLVQTMKFDSYLDAEGVIVHTYKMIPGVIEDSHGVEVLKSLGILKTIL